MAGTIHRGEIVRRFCALNSEVAERKFGHRFAHDCFCGDNPLSFTMRHQDEGHALQWIEQVIRERLEVEGL